MTDEFRASEQNDSCGMHHTLRAFPRQCEQALAAGDGFSTKQLAQLEDINQILFCGLGGSAIGGNALQAVYNHPQIPITVHRDYHLPSSVDSKTLVITTSYSGNTEETLSCYRDATQTGCQIIAVTGGGQLAQMAIKDGVSLIQTVPGLPPRCAVGFLALPVAVVLSKIFAVRTDFQELSDTLTTISESCALETDRKHNPAKKLALELRGKTPHFYGTRGLTEVVARRAKTQLNENVKRFASWGIFPEVCHNEIVPWSGDGSIDLSGFQPVFVRDKAEPRRIQQRIDITQHLLAEEGQGYSQIWTRGKEALTRVFSGIYIADWMSYYLAVLEGTDPTPVRFIDRLKDELKKTI